MSDETARVIDRELKSLIRAFRPLFANPRHIEITTLLEELRKADRLLRFKQRAAADIPRMQAKVDKLKRQAHYLLKSS